MRLAHRGSPIKAAIGALLSVGVRQIKIGFSTLL
jgi:hypothetical protein